MASSPCTPHIVLFPFMSKGHTIPILHLARLLLHRNATVTIFTTPTNHPFISASLANTNASIIDLPFPENIDELPTGVESTEKLPSMSLFVPFANATKHIQPDLEKALEALSNVTCLISDFLGWTLESRTKFGNPRLVSYGGATTPCVCTEKWRESPTFRTRVDDEILTA
ncbi:UDP-glycosyltransferase 90A1 [Camellia lanceoleosa]|uniref:UDP-glycosyltransferase 90A1 n=1 Tax=Camellia lanceoleosa TaxID=1840588 RepID=A0ACC0I0V7_9ERIC|nr:UDP-glycosyltransferase 90A1 [Camellia lanceoleosa]